MAIVNKIIHRFVRNRADYMDPTKDLYNQIIPYNVQAYSYELKENGDPNIPDDYIVRYVLGTGRSTYQQIADGQGKDADGNAIPEFSKEFVINSDTQLAKIITDLITEQVLTTNYISYDQEGNPFPTKADLDNAEVWYVNGESVLPKKNDYTIVLSDESHSSGSGENPISKYVCVNVVNERPVWNFQYSVNNTNFTEAQEAAINSGITTEKVEAYDNCLLDVSTIIYILVNHVLNVNNPHDVTAEQVGLGNVDNTSDLDKPISTATQEALDNLSETINEHASNEDIHVTLKDKDIWENKQDALKMGDHIKITNDVISVLDNLADYDNSVSRFVDKSTKELENYYTKEELTGIYRYRGEVPTISDLPTGNIYAPNSYFELMYLTADQLEYINTNYYPNQRTSIELIFSINGAGNNYLYGTDIEHEINQVAFGINYGASVAKAIFGDETIDNIEIDSEVHRLVQNKVGLYIDSIQVGKYVNIEDFTTESPLWLFRAQTSDTHPQNISIYEIKIYEGEELVKHYIPVKRRSDNALGLYEVLTQDFKQNEYNLEEFDFTPGPQAGYENTDGDVYKVLADGYFYMWHNHRWIITEQAEKVDGITIERTEDGYLRAIGVKTKSDDIMYDWIGTEEEWEQGRQNGTISDDWICWITDDEDQPTGIANLAQVASTGDYNDLTNKPITLIPDLPIDKTTNDFLLIWNHSTQQLEWIQTDMLQGEYDPITDTLSLSNVYSIDDILITEDLEPMEN